MSVKVDETQSFVAFAKGLDYPGERSNCDRMIAADSDGQLPSVSDRFYLGRQPFTCNINFSEILCFLAGRRHRTWPIDAQIAQILDFIAQRRNSTYKSGNPNCPRPEIDSSHALPKTQRHTEQADALA